MNTYKSGGDINEQNKEMLMSQAIEFKHHAEELMNALKKVDDIDSWVIAKAERATTDLSDITHYLEGRSKKMANGGIIQLPEKIMQEVQESLSSGYTIIQEGLIGKNRRGVVLIDENYKVRGVYPLKYKEAIENLKKSMGYSKGGYMEEGGETEEGEDLLEDIENLPEEVQEILSNYEVEIEDGDYKAIEQALKELEEIGYTFDYGLDGTIFNLRKIGQKGKHEADMEHGGYMEKGGSIKYIPGKDYMTGDGWTVYADKDGGNFNIRVDYQSSWHIDPHRKLGQPDVLELWSGGKLLASFTMPKGGMSLFDTAKKLHDRAQNERGKNKFSIEEYNDILKLYFDMQIDYQKRQKKTSISMEKGGKVKFEDKVASIKRKLLERKSVSPSVQKDYGKTYSEEEAEESAKRIAGAMRKRGY